MTISLRRAAPGDVPRIERLVLDAYEPWRAVLDHPPLPVLADYASAVEKHAVDLAVDAGAICGVIETIRDGNDLLIVNVAVAPKWQGRGLGRALITHAAESARSAGLARLRLYTNARMERNITLYRSLGFTIDRDEMKDGREIVHMSRPS